MRAYMNNCIRTNLFSAFDCIWLLERLPQVSAQSEHTIPDLQHFMSEQIDLHTFFKAITAASCVDIIVNKHLNKYN